MGERQANITVQVQPNARRNEALGFRSGVLYIKIAAPPVKGEANRELINFLSKLIGVNKGSISIKSGHTGRRKVIIFTGLDREYILERIKPSEA